MGGGDAGGGSRGVEVKVREAAGGGVGVEGPPFLVWDGQRAPLISLMMSALYSGLTLGKLHQDLPHCEQNKSN